ncbi:MAG: hypothetical protein CMN87_08965 [Stappia sp.]|uniref:response regulator n=1 Tax=Stappia sp. TaxID=1870903 RepID=UPI000C59EC15|nr:response regulator [Stappia sp.]MAB00992.1 hypothetical protein [Stappia sp.]MBM20127.1 hypothetical protein [Stappia sp.]
MTITNESELAPDETAVLLHDLRTPLAAMRTAAEIVAGEPLSQRQADALHTLELAIDSLLAITRNALDGAPAPARATAETSALETIDAVADLFDPAARSRGLTLTRDLDGDLAAYGLSDPLTLRRILSVLLDNALKYTGEGGVRLAATVHRGGPRPELDLTLSDTGIGIEDDERATLFRPMSRGRRARGHAAGSGLGLWSASRLALACGGMLDLVDTSPAGSTFALRLPLVAPAQREAGDATAPIQADGHETVRPAPCVLVVDDSATNRRMIEVMLEAAGFRVVLADGGAEALACLAHAPGPDCVLLDLTMPDMSGLETIEAMRALEAGACVPVIGITAAVVPDRARLSRAGFTTVLDKPVAPARLIDAIARAIDGSRAEDD